MPVRSPEFRYVFSNTLGMGLTDNDVRLVFGISEDLTKPEEALEQVGVMMTHRTAKILSELLTTALSHFEKVSGKEIEFDKVKFDSLTSTALVNAGQIASDGEQP